jgi:glycosyltransferase involved in cell wall biosynthesis
MPTGRFGVWEGLRLKGAVAENKPRAPLVTVITAVFNGQRYLGGCLESVLRQTYRNIEHLVIDGGSSDGTVELLRSYSNRIALWKSEPDQGIYDAWNKALVEARGEWICFLGADDEFLPNAIGAYMTLAAENPEAEYLSSRVRIVHADGYGRTLGCAWSWRKFAKFMCTPHVGSMHRRSLLHRLGAYDTSYRIVADYELLLRARASLSTAYLPAVTVTMRAGGASCARAALHEQARAKVAAGGRGRLRAALELYAAHAKYSLRWLRLGG